MIFGINTNTHTSSVLLPTNTYTHTQNASRGGRLQVWSLLCLSAAGRSFLVMSLSMCGGWANTHSLGNTALSLGKQY